MGVYTLEEAGLAVKYTRLTLEYARLVLADSPSRAV